MESEQSLAAFLGSPVVDYGPAYLLPPGEPVADEGGGTVVTTDEYASLIYAVSTEGGLSCYQMDLSLYWEIPGTVQGYEYDSTPAVGRDRTVYYVRPVIEIGNNHMELVATSWTGAIKWVQDLPSWCWSCTPNIMTVSSGQYQGEDWIIVLTGISSGVLTAIYDDPLTNQPVIRRQFTLAPWVSDPPRYTYPRSFLSDACINPANNCVYALTNAHPAVPGLETGMLVAYDLTKSSSGSV